MGSPLGWPFFIDMKINYGIKMMLVASFLFATMNVFVKMLSHIPVVEIVLFRSVISLIISLGILMGSGTPILGNNRKILLLRGVFGSIGLISFFYTLHNMPLATAVVVHYLSPFFTTLIAAWWLKEKFYKWQGLFFLLCFAGILVVKGFDPRVELFPLLVGLLATIASGGAYNCIRRLKNTENPNVIILYFPLVTVPVVSILLFTVFDWVMPVGMDWVYLILVGVLTQFAQYFLTRAYQSESAGTVSFIMYIGIFYTLLYGTFIFNEYFSWPVVGGMLLILTGVLSNVFYVQWRNKKLKNVN